MTETTLKRGDTGDEVRALQAALCALGWDVPITGVFDADTVTAVMAFQVAAGMVEDGEATPSVRRRIDDYINCNQADH